MCCCCVRLFVCVNRCVCACCLKFIVMFDCVLLLCVFACVLGVLCLFSVFVSFVIVLNGVIWFGCCVLACVRA